MTYLEEFGRITVPKKFQPSVREYLYKAGVTKQPYTFFGLLFFITFAITIISYFWFAYLPLNSQGLIALLIGSFIYIVFVELILVAAVMLITYFYLDLVIFNRTAKIEQILPDYLQIVSTNVKSGMGLEKSLWFAIKPQFGIIANEMEIVLKRVMTGVDLDEALIEFSEKYESPMLHRALALITGEIESGGKIAHIIDSVVGQLKEAQKMKAEMAASVITYMIFIGAIVVVISPALFSLSYHLLTLVKMFMGRVAESGAADSSAIPLGSGQIDLDLFRQFSIVAMLIVSLMSSMIVSIIESGKIRSGLKYVAIFIVGSGVAYFIFSAILEAIFGGITI